MDCVDVDAPSRHRLSPPYVSSPCGSRVGVDIALTAEWSCRDLSCTSPLPPSPSPLPPLPIHTILTCATVTGNCSTTSSAPLNLTHTTQKNAHLETRLVARLITSLSSRRCPGSSQHSKRGGHHLLNNYNCSPSSQESSATYFAYQLNLA